jgi:hypothetical protein
MICRKSVQLYAGGTESLAPLTAEKRSIIRSNRGPTFFFFFRGNVSLAVQPQDR